MVVKVTSLCQDCLVRTNAEGQNWKAYKSSFDRIQMSKNAKSLFLKTLDCILKASAWRQTKRDTEDKERGGENSVKTKSDKQKKRRKIKKNDTQRKDREKEK